MNEVEQKMFNKFGVVESKPCKFKLGCGHAIPCDKCERPLVFPPVTFTKICMLEEIINKEYNILIVEKMSNSTRITACPAPEQDWGADEAYFRQTVEQPTKSDAICELIVKIYDDLTPEIKAEVKGLLEAF